MLGYGFMQAALAAAVLVGVMAPTVGVHLVQRRLSIIGDGIGHMALSGVALGLVTGWTPLGAAMVVAVVGAVVVELLRRMRRAEADALLAVLFAGGMAGGVVLVDLVPEGRPANLDAYLFGAIVTATTSDLAVLAAVSAVVLLVTVGLWRPLFAVGGDGEWATAVRLPAARLDLLVAVTTAVTVVVSMRILGLLLISALMVLPAAAAMALTASFRRALLLAVGIGTACAVIGTVAAFYLEVPAGGAIVLLAVAAFGLASTAPAAWRRVCRARGMEVATPGRGSSALRAVPVEPRLGLLP